VNLNTKFFNLQIDMYILITMSMFTLDFFIHSSIRNIIFLASTTLIPIFVAIPVFVAFLLANWKS
jgi:hypothetical protein